MKLSKLSIITSSLLLVACSSKPSLEVSLPERYEGQTIEIMDYLDSTSLASAFVEGGFAELLPATHEAKFTAVMIDGRISAFYITEAGKASLKDSLDAAVGTPLNDKFNVLLARLDSVEQYDDMDLYMDFVEKNYNDNKDNPIGEYFGLEWVRFADPEKVDSMLNLAPERFRNSKKVKYYENFAKLRSNTSPGKPFIDFEGEDENGNTVALSSFMIPDSYTLIDFWASWCPYCIKELPELQELKKKWGDKGLNIVGVAVRDLPEDTKAAFGKHNIPWKVLYNAQRKPYDIYGFSGIPHHILISPDGTIISRGENAEQTDQRLEELLSETNKK